jgi:hypothetical protein
MGAGGTDGFCACVADESASMSRGAVKQGSMDFGFMSRAAVSGSFPSVSADHGSLFSPKTGFCEPVFLIALNDKWNIPPGRMLVPPHSDPAGFSWKPIPNGDIWFHIPRFVSAS